MNEDPLALIKAQMQHLINTQRKDRIIYYPATNKIEIEVGWASPEVEELFNRLIEMVRFYEQIYYNDWRTNDHR